MSQSKTAARPSMASCYEGDASHQNAVCRVALEFSILVALSWWVFGLGCWSASFSSEFTAADPSTSGDHERSCMTSTGRDLPDTVDPRGPKTK